MQEYLILGIIQGILEWIPVSSEGFLVMVGSYFNLEKLVPLALYLHIGTVTASAFYFKKDLKRLALGKDRELLRFLIISTAFTMMIGGLIYPLLQSNFLGGEIILGLVGVGLIITGWFLGKKKGSHSGLSEINRRDAILIGLLQGIAIIPGISRSGLTTFGLLARNYKQDIALKISFIMSIPVILAGGIFLHISGFEFQPVYLIALISAFLVGLGSISSLIKISKRINFRYFCWFFGVLALAGFLIGLG